MPRAFVAGATGYTGRAVARELCRRQVEVVAHVRPDSNELDRRTRELEEIGAAVDSSPWEERAMADTLAAVAPSHVFSLLGTTRARARAARAEANGVPTYDSIDYGLTALLIEAACSIHPPPRFIYLSATGVSASRPRNPYYLARWKAERDLVDSGLRAVIARPGLITGNDREERRYLERIAALLGDRALGAAGRLGAKRLRDRYLSFTASELATALVSLALSDKGGVCKGEILRRYAHRYNRP